MAQPYPQEFRDDVVWVARNRDQGVTIEQIAADFGVHPITLSKCMRQAAVDDGSRPGTSTCESAELRELRRRNRLLEQENEVLRRAAAYLSQSNLPGKALPAREGARANGNSRDGDVPGPQARPPALLPLAGRSGHRRRIPQGAPCQRLVRCPPRRPGVRLPVPGRRSPRCRGSDGRTDRLADLC